MSEAGKDKHAPQGGSEDRENQEKRQQGGVRPGTSPTASAPANPAEVRRIREEALDKTIEDTFPSSDPPSTIPNPGEDEEAA